MKYASFFFLSLVFPFCLFAQYKNAPMGKVTYLQETSTEGDRELNGVASLLFNTDHSLYIHQGTPKQDSSLSKHISVNIAGDSEGFPIYKRHRERTMACRITCDGMYKKEKYCLVSDTLEDIVWRIEPDFKRFSTYNCQKAMGEFRGRTYEAWFAPDIPISSGPFKLGGLPGLILEATSTDGKVKFTFVQLETGENVSGEIKSPSGWDLQMSQTHLIKEQDARDKAFLEKLTSKGLQVSVTRSETIEVWKNNY
jgi:GLPGLI family protein